MNLHDPSRASPQLTSAKLQVPQGNEQVKKRRRNTSGGSSDPPTPPTNGSHAARLHEYSFNPSHLTLMTGSSGGLERNHEAAPSVFSHPPSQYSFPIMHETFPHSHPASHFGYKHFTQEGLESTLAQRNSSAAQFYNIQELSPRSNPITLSSGRPNTSHAERGPTQNHGVAFEFTGPASAPHETGGNMGYYLNDTALPFEQPPVSLPNMPFGMPSFEHGHGPGQGVSVHCFGIRTLETLTNSLV